MTPPHATVDELRQAISTEILIAAGLPRRSPLQPILRPLVWPPAQRFARLASEFDRRVAASGLTSAVRWALDRFVEGVRVLGAEHIPATGPLVVASNHPGSYDGLLIASALARDDLKIIASDVPFLRHMVASAPHLIYTTSNAQVRMAVARESIRHLEAGGALLVYATGVVDPDPALLAGARESLQDWSGSLPLFLRRVPETALVVTIVSGVLAPSCFRHPLTRLRKTQRQKQFLAEFIQIGQQILLDRRFPITPTVRFAPPLTASDVGTGSGAQSTAVMDAIIARAEGLLSESTRGE
jgi:1-acyl-sn-glycerol-3-phosphate acyltransferase